MNLYVIRVLQGKHKRVPVHLIFSRLMTESCDYDCVETFKLLISFRVVFRSRNLFEIQCFADCGKEFGSKLKTVVRQCCGQYSEVNHPMFHEDFDNPCRLWSSQ